MTARGDRQEAIYEDDEDRQTFLEVLADVADRFDWWVHAYCEMTNHYHLLIETPDGNLSKGMRQLNGVYTQYSNRRHGRVGHLFQRRYKAILVQKESYLLEVARYIVLNPVRAQMVRSAGDWPWSSYRATAGRVAVRRFLTAEWILSAFGDRLKESQVAYPRFVSEGRGQPAPWVALASQVLLGDDTFVDRMRSKLDNSNRSLAEVPRAQRVGRAKPVADFAGQSATRDEAVVRAYAPGAYSMAEIGAHFGVHYSTVSRAVRAAERGSQAIA